MQGGDGSRIACQGALNLFSIATWCPSSSVAQIASASKWSPDARETPQTVSVVAGSLRGGTRTGSVQRRRRLDRDEATLDELEDLELLSKDELIEMLLEQAEAGVKLTFPGKATSRRITRRVRPRVQRAIAKYGAGPDAERAKNAPYRGRQPSGARHALPRTGSGRPDPDRSAVQHGR